MASRKKNSRKKGGRKKSTREVAPKRELPSGFWQQVVAVVLIALSLLFVVSWFNKGGVVFQNIHQFSFRVMGYSAYLLPLILVYISVMIFKSENNRLSPGVWLSAVLMLFWCSGIFGVPTYQQANPTGGVVGEALNLMFIQMTNTGVAVFIYILLIFVTALFMYAKTPAAIFRGLTDFFAGKNEEDSKNARVMRKNATVESPATVDDDIENLNVKQGNEIIGAEKVKAKAPAPAKPEPKTALVAISDPNWKMPPVDLLSSKQTPADAGNIKQNALIIKNTYSEFGIDVEMKDANMGPRITQYTLKPPAGIKLSKLAGLDRDLAGALAQDKIRIEAPIPGSHNVGIEVPNVKQASVGLRSLLESESWIKTTAEKPLAFTVGKDISGEPVIGDLAKMPHLLIAGTTGSGKSVMTNVLLSSLLYHNSPADLKLLIVDPKQVEMAQYEDIPHLLAPVITGVDKALSALKWATNEMERRYKLMAEERVKNIISYNSKMAKDGGQVTMTDAEGNEQQHDGGRMPYIVIVIDEMADLMMMAGKELETFIVRIAQKGRAAGVHLVLATQRPEVKVVTGLIKANIPGRIAFAVNNGIDSRVMLDKTGAEKLLGSGDMLFLTTEMMGKPRRVQGAFMSDKEIADLVDFLKQQAPPDYNDEVLSQAVQIKGMPGIEMDGVSLSGDGDLLRQATEVGLQMHRMSTSTLQRRLKIGYGRAAGLIDELEAMGVVGPSNGNKPREMLITSMDEFPG